MSWTPSWANYNASQARDEDPSKSHNAYFALKKRDKKVI